MDSSSHRRWIGLRRLIFAIGMALVAGIGVMPAGMANADPESCRIGAYVADLYNDKIHFAGRGPQI